MMRRLKDLPTYSLTRAEMLEQREGVGMLALAMFFGATSDLAGRGVWLFHSMMLIWRCEKQNRYRPYSLLGYLTPGVFDEQATVAEMVADSANSETILMSTLSF